MEQQLVQLKRTYAEAVKCSAPVYIVVLTPPTTAAASDEAKEEAVAVSAACKNEPPVLLDARPALFELIGESTHNLGGKVQKRRMSKASFVGAKAAAKRRSRGNKKQRRMSIFSGR